MTILLQKGCTFVMLTVDQNQIQETKGQLPDITQQHL